MTNNPFSSDTFTTVWLKIFNEQKSSFQFPYFEQINFVRSNAFKIYSNVGGTNTKGVSYGINPDLLSPNFNDACFLIYDVPQYFGTKVLEHENVGFIKLKQYPGFLINAGKYNSLDNYLSSNFSKSSRYKLKKYRKKLEKCFNIEYKMFYGSIDRSTYDSLFQSFRELLEKRFDDKQVYNNNLDSKEWEFYHSVSYPMILEKKAGLFVIYNDGKPIGITLNYFSEDILFDAITVFDIDYGKFHLGSITIMKLIEWCIQSGFNTMDFSKGYFDYKKRWANLQYDFEYHIYYNRKSSLSKSKAFLISNFYRLKQLLRENGINEKLHKLTYKLNNKKVEAQDTLRYEFKKDDRCEFKLENYTKLCWYNHESLRKSLVFEFLYLFEENEKNINLYSDNISQNSYCIQCESGNYFASPLVSPN